MAKGVDSSMCGCVEHEEMHKSKFGLIDRATITDKLQYLRIENHLIRIRPSRWTLDLDLVKNLSRGSDSGATVCFIWWYLFICPFLLSTFLPLLQYL